MYPQTTHRRGRKRPAERLSSPDGEFITDVDSVYSLYEKEEAKETKCRRYRDELKLDEIFEKGLYPNDHCICGSLWPQECYCSYGNLECPCEFCQLAAQYPEVLDYNELMDQKWESRLIEAALEKAPPLEDVSVPMDMDEF